MTPNVGTADRVIRLVVGILLLLYAALGTSPWRWVGLIGIIPILTALFRFCPAYALIGIRTCPAQKEAH
jgi:hypothetical protein